MDQLAQIKRDFTYKSDPKRDQWRIGPMQGAFAGDCEDFALTLLLRLTGSEKAMCEALDSGHARIEHVIAASGNGHAILWADGLGYVDSAYQYWREDRLFKYSYTYTPQMIRRKLAGKIVIEPRKKPLALILVLLMGIGLALTFA